MSDYKWYAGDGEIFYCGPFGSKEDAVKNGVKYFDDRSFTVIEAKKGNVVVADYFDGNEWVEHLENGSFDDLIYDEPLFDYAGVTPEQIDDMTARVKAALKQWQDENNIQIVPFVFEDSRNHEVINPTKPHPMNPNQQRTNP